MTVEEKIERIKVESSDASALMEFRRFKEAYLKDLSIMRFISDKYEPELKFYRLSVASNIASCLYAMERYEEAYELCSDVLQEAKAEYGVLDDTVFMFTDNLMRIAFEIDGKEEEAGGLASSLHERQIEKYGADDNRCKKTYKFIKKCISKIDGEDNLKCGEFVKEIIGFRYYTKESYGYDFYMDKVRQFSVNTTNGARPKTRIRCKDKEFECDFMDITDLHDGIMRTVYEKKSHKPVFSLTYFHDPYFYTLSGSFGDIMVEEVDDFQYRYIRDNTIIGGIKMINRNEWIPEAEGKDYQPSYQFVMCDRKAKTFEVAAMISFPMLRFA